MSLLLLWNRTKFNIHAYQLYMSSATPSEVVTPGIWQMSLVGGAIYPAVKVLKIQDVALTYRKLWRFSSLGEFTLLADGSQWLPAFVYASYGCDHKCVSPGEVRWNRVRLWTFSTVLPSGCFYVVIYIYIYIYIYTECNRRNGPDFGRGFLRSNYTDITQNTYIQSSMITEILAREVWNFDSYYSLIDYQIHIETSRNMWFL